MRRLNDRTPTIATLMKFVTRSKHRLLVLGAVLLALLLFGSDLLLLIVLSLKGSSASAAMAGGSVILQQAHAASADDFAKLPNLNQACLVVSSVLILASLTWGVLLTLIPKFAGAYSSLTKNASFHALIYLSYLLAACEALRVHLPVVRPWHAAFSAALVFVVLASPRHAHHRRHSTNMPRTRHPRAAVLRVCMCTLLMFCLTAGAFLSTVPPMLDTLFLLACLCGTIIAIGSMFRFARDRRGISLPLLLGAGLQVFVALFMLLQQGGLFPGSSLVAHLVFFAATSGLLFAVGLSHQAFGVYMRHFHIFDTIVMDAQASVHSPAYCHLMLKHFRWRAEILDAPLCLMFVDVGRLFGGRGAHIREVANILRSHLREWDVLSRYGGDVFVIILPDVQLTAAIHMAEAIRAQFGYRASSDPAVIALSSPGTDQEEPLPSAAISVAELRDGESTWDFLMRADAALHRGKAHGMHGGAASSSNIESAS